MQQNRRFLRPSTPEITLPSYVVRTTPPVWQWSKAMILTSAPHDNWRSTQQVEIIATGLQPPNDAEPAIVATLVPSNYTMIVRGVNNTSGVALVEAYRLN